MKKERVRNYVLAHDMPRFEENLHLRVDRKSLGVLTDELDNLINRFGGLAVYSPDIARGINFCTYTFHYYHATSETYYQIGIQLEVNKVGFSAKASLTTDAIIDTQSTDLHIPRDVIKILDLRLTRICKIAVGRVTCGKLWPTHHLFFVEFEDKLGFTQLWKSEGVTIYPTVRCRDGRRVSALIITVPAGPTAIARKEASKQANRHCALMSIAGAKLARMITPPHNSGQTFSSIGRTLPTETSNLMPWEFSEVSDTTDRSKSLEWMLSCWELLSVENRTLYEKAALAAYSGMFIKESMPTISVVSHAAALSSLAETYKEPCIGTLTCNIHGPQSFKHNLVGEAKAIHIMISSIIDLDSDLLKIIKDLVASVYGRQRSSFVHAAQFRHNEFDTNPEMSKPKPTDDDIVPGVVHDTIEATCFIRLTRHVLLYWLSSKSDIPIDRQLLGITTHDYSLFQNDYTILCDGGTGGALVIRQTFDGSPTRYGPTQFVAEHVPKSTRA